MKKNIPITTLFLDIGGELLTNGWDHHARRRAAKHFKLDWAEMEQRHGLNFETHEEDKLTFNEYLDRVVFYEKRPFTRAEFRRFMFAQSQPFPEMIELVRSSESQIRIENFRRQQRVARIERASHQHVQAGGFVDAFISSCFVRLRKPDADIFKLALDIAQTPARQIVYVENTADVRSDRGRHGHSRHSSQGLQIHMRETGFVRIGDRMDEPEKPSILTINGGSSSIKFALYAAVKPLKRGLHGKVDRIGLSGTNMTFIEPTKKRPQRRKLAAADHKSAANSLIDWLEKQIDFASVKAVGHRVVHGMKHTEPEIVTQDLLDELHRISPYDPDHLPREIELIETFRQRHPKLPQVACFDTAFHQTMPRVAKLLPIPRRFDAKGIQRYGFHGLSYAYLMEELARLGDPAATKGRVILAHLGNGASLAAVRDGKSIDTSMGFTPTAGLVMSTRSGDLDPGLAPYLARTEQMTTKQFYEMVNHESGLLGVSETSSDMRDLLEHETQDVRAAEAVALFCYQAKKWIGAFAAALGGLDTLVFAGGIGENAPAVRARICEGLDFLGIEMDEARNARMPP